MKLLSLLLVTSALSAVHLRAQDTLSVLFLGNSYTAFNNLPQLVQNLTISAGKTLNIDSNSPGGMTLEGHVADAVTFAKISEGNWDYVVIQEQSQIPAIDYYRYNSMYPALTELKALVEQYNPCARLITYMTWGRRFGGQQCDQTSTYCSPDFADFNHMQDSLTSAYTEISDILGVQCAPVGVTWQHILNDTTVVLHSADNSHPNQQGSYVAALTLFSSIWRQPSFGLDYAAGLDASLAQYYQEKSDLTVFGSEPDWNLYINNPVADFAHSVDGNTVNFTNLSAALSGNALDYAWEFGDGSAASVENPVHTYADVGVYEVQLVVTDCLFADTVQYMVEVGATGISRWDERPVRIFPNPFEDNITVALEAVSEDCAYQLADVSGQIICSGKLASGITTLGVEYLPAGVYVLGLSGRTRQYFRLVKH